MLILFKPWRDGQRVRNQGQTWEDAFGQFLSESDDRIKNIMDNMQLLHECKDSRDDHFSQRQSRHRSNRVPSEISNCTGNEMCEGGDDFDDNLVLDHLHMIDACHSIQFQRSTENIITCLNYAEHAGMFAFNDSNHIVLSHSNEHVMDVSNAVQHIEDHNLDFEQECHRTYDLRRDEWK